MSRILGIDFGEKSCGLSATDPLQIIVTNLGAIKTNELFEYLKTYLAQESVSKIVFGKPLHADGTPTFLWKKILKFVENLNKLHPDLLIDYEEEAFTSQKATQIILQSGIRKSKRRNKGLVDSVSAVIILQQYLGHI